VYLLNENVGKLDDPPLREFDGVEEGMEMKRWRR
jgi:hypothetical protein